MGLKLIENPKTYKDHKHELLIDVVLILKKVVGMQIVSYKFLPYCNCKYGIQESSIL